MRIGTTERGDGGLDLSWMRALERKRVGGVIVITKAPQNLLDLDLPDPVVVHCTITGHGGSVLEPGVAPPGETTAAYKKLAERYGGERVVLRIDPILALDTASILQAKGLRDCAVGRVRVSFMDFYDHVRTRFKQKGIKYDQPCIHAPLDIRRALWEELGKPELCGEPGLPCTGCVSMRDACAMDLDGTLGNATGMQRKDCRCAAEKTELLKQRGQCAHGCVYCYWH